MLVLDRICQGPTYGYALLIGLKDDSNGFFALKEGTLYPILYRLEDDGFITAAWSVGEGKTAPKKIYTATAKGLEEQHRRRHRHSPRHLRPTKTEVQAGYHKSHNEHHPGQSHHALLRRLLFLVIKPLFQKRRRFDKQDHSHDQHGKEEQRQKKPCVRIIQRPRR